MIVIEARLLESSNHSLDADLVARSGLFDSKFYLTTYPDVGWYELEPLDHFLSIGGREARNPHPLFDTAFYLARNSDVIASGLNPIVHYIRVGAPCGADPHPLFDTAFYLNQIPQLTAIELNPLSHYLVNGLKSERDPHPLFETRFYLSNNPDASASGLNPLVHYLLYGWQEGFDPHPLFDTSFYLQQYPDVAENGINPLKHFVEHGQAEKRLARNLFLAEASTSFADFYPSLCRIEPLLPSAAEVEGLPLRNSLKDSLAGETYFKLANSLEKPFSHLVFIGAKDENHLRDCRFIESLVAEHGVDSVIAMALDQTGLESSVRIKESLPPGIRFIDAAVVPRELTLFNRMMIAVRIILQAEPEFVYSCQSDLCSIVFSEYAQQLQAITSLIDCTSRQLKTISETLRPQAQTQESQATPGEGCAADPLFDVSLVITCHGEGQLLATTIAAAHLAVQHARASGLSVEWLFVLDLADRATCQCLENNMPQGARVLELALGDPGLARNAGAKDARGEFVAFLDGDDLVSSNWLQAAHSFAQSLDSNHVILHPPATIYFGESRHIRLYYDSEDPQYSSTALMEDSAWLTNPFAKRSLYLQHPYRRTDAEAGFDFEDWLWNCDTIADGIAHKVVADTFFCYRVKPSFASRNAGAHSSLLDKSKFFNLKFQNG